MHRPISIVLAASAALFGVTSAKAGTHWSVGINVPVPVVAVSNGGYYGEDPAPVYYQPVPVVRYAPPVVYYAPPVEYSAPQPVYQVPYRGWQGDDSRWEQRHKYEHARWEHARHEREEHRNRSDEDEGRRWHRD